MTSQSNLEPLSPKELDQYGFGRARDIAFDAIQKLWRQRQNEGMRQVDIARALDWDPALVSKKLQGPGNWTMRTLGALAEAMNGDLHIAVLPNERPLIDRRNADAYSGYGNSQKAIATSSSTAPKLLSKAPFFLRDVPND